jgi:Ca2+-binding RTX toxin-like protein
MTTTTRRLRRAAVLAGVSLVFSGALFTSPASALPTCNGLPVDYFVPAGGALFLDPGGNGGNVILGTPGPDLIDGLGGDDIICGREEDDTINGGTGEDNLLGNNGDDTLDGDGDDDFLQGGPDVDFVDGDTGDDILHGGSETDTIYGRAGANQVACGTGGGDFADGGAEAGAEDDILLDASCEFTVGF